jgi:hypothetical protein
MSDHQFSIVQGRAVTDRRVSDSVFRTLSALGMYADKNGWCFPKQGTLGEDVGKTQQRVSEDILTLSKLGYVQIVPQYDPITNARMQNKYRLLHDTPPTENVEKISVTPTENVEKISVTPTENVEKISVDNVPLNVPYNTANDKNHVVAEPENQKPAKKTGDLPGQVPGAWGVDWQIVSGQKALVQQDVDEAKRIDSANLLAMGKGVDFHLSYSIAYAFMKTRGIIIPESKVKGQRKAIREMIEMGVLPTHVIDATQQLMDKQMTVTDLFSISKTAIALANPAPDSKNSATEHDKFEGV